MKNNRNFGAFFPHGVRVLCWWKRILEEESLPNFLILRWNKRETSVTTIGRRRERCKSCSIAKYVTILGTLFEKTIKGTQRVLGNGYWDKIFLKFRASRFISERRISSIFKLIFLTRRRSFCGSQQPFFKWSVISWMQKKELHGNKSTKYYKSCSHFEF